MFAVFRRCHLQEVDAAERKERKKTGRQDLCRLLNARRVYCWLPTTSSIPRKPLNTKSDGSNVYNILYFGVIFFHVYWSRTLKYCTASKFGAPLFARWRLRLADSDRLAGKVTRVPVAYPEFFIGGCFRGKIYRKHLKLKTSLHNYNRISVTVSTSKPSSRIRQWRVRAPKIRTTGDTNDFQRSFEMSCHAYTVCKY